MRKVFLLLLLLLLTPPALAVRVVRYSAAVPPGSSFELERDGDTVVLLSPADRVQGGTEEIVFAGESELVTSWTSNKIHREIRTTRRANEGGPAGAHTFAARHREAEQAALNLWPPDPPSTGFLHLPGSESSALLAMA